MRGIFPFSSKSFFKSDFEHGAKFVLIFENDLEETENSRHSYSLPGNISRKRFGRTRDVLDLPAPIEDEGF